MTTHNLLESPYTYRADPRCTVEMHGGGILFASVVQWIFKFEFVESGTTSIDSFGGDTSAAPSNIRGIVRWEGIDLDSGAISERGRGLMADGEFAINDQGYLHCTFPKLEFYARPCRANPKVLICCAYWWRDNRESGFCLWPYTP